MDGDSAPQDRLDWAVLGIVGEGGGLQRIAAWVLHDEGGDTGGKALRVFGSHERDLLSCGQAKGGDLRGGGV